MAHIPPRKAGIGLSQKQKDILDKLVAENTSLVLNFDCTKARLACLSRDTGFNKDQVKTTLCKIAARIGKQNILPKVLQDAGIPFDENNGALQKRLKENSEVFVREGPSPPTTPSSTPKKFQLRTPSNSTSTGRSSAFFTSASHSAKKGRFSDSQKEILEISWKTGLIGQKEKHGMIASLANLEVKQVKIWLSNKKAKMKCQPPKVNSDTAPFVKKQRFSGETRAVLERAFAQDLMIRENFTFIALLAKISVKQVAIWASNRKAKLKKDAQKELDISDTTGTGDSDTTMAIEPAMVINSTTAMDSATTVDSTMATDSEQDDEGDENYTNSNISKYLKDENLLINHRPKRSMNYNYNGSEMFDTAGNNEDDGDVDESEAEPASRKRRAESQSSRKKKKPRSETTTPRASRPFTSDQRKILEKAYQKGIYEDRSTHTLLSGLTGLEKKQVTRWFVDRRRRVNQNVAEEPIIPQRKGQFLDEQKNVLEYAFQHNLFSTSDQIRILTLLTELKEKQVKRWFVDRRRRTQKKGSPRGKKITTKLPSHLPVGSRHHDEKSEQRIRSSSKVVLPSLALSLPLPMDLNPVKPPEFMKAENTRTPVEDTCPKGHELTFATQSRYYQNAFNCDVCREDKVGTPGILSCSTCQYDVCVACSSQKPLSIGSPATPPLEDSTVSAYNDGDDDNNAMDTDGDATDEVTLKETKLEHVKEESVRAQNDNKGQPDVYTVVQKEEITEPDDVIVEDHSSNQMDLTPDGTPLQASQPLQTPQASQTSQVSQEDSGEHPMDIPAEIPTFPDEVPGENVPFANTSSSPTDFSDTVNNSGDIEEADLKNGSKPQDTCQKGHELTFTTQSRYYQNAFNCDVCREDKLGTTGILSCFPCQYDVCMDCFSQNASDELAGEDSASGETKLPQIPFQPSLDPPLPPSLDPPLPPSTPPPSELQSTPSCDPNQEHLPEPNYEPNVESHPQVKLEVPTKHQRHQHPTRPQTQAPTESLGESKSPGIASFMPIFKQESSDASALME